jgi:hypothetical protein
LEGLLYAVEQAPEDWKARFIEEWSELEIPYAVALNRQEKIPDATDPTIRMAVDALIALVHERFADSE